MFLVAAPARAEITGDQIGGGAELTLGYTYGNNGQRLDPTPSNSAWQNGGVVGVLTSLRWRNLRGGLFGEIDGNFGPGGYRIGNASGIAWEPAPGLRFEALGEIGVHAIVAHYLLDSSSGDDTALFPFLGARLGFAFRLGWEHAGTLGLWLGLRADLGRATLHPTVFDDSRAQTWNVGGESFWIGLRLGLEK